MTADEAELAWEQRLCELKAYRLALEDTLQGRSRDPDAPWSRIVPLRHPPRHSQGSGRDWKGNEMTTLQTAAQQALEALEELNGWQSLAPPLASEAGRKAAINLRAALAESAPDWSICPACGGMASDPIVPQRPTSKEE